MEDARLEDWRAEGRHVKSEIARLRMRDCVLKRMMLKIKSLIKLFVLLLSAVLYQDLISTG